MFWRDVPAYGCFFFIYNYLENLLVNKNDSFFMQNLKKLLAIGTAGFINWIPTYPFDVLKTIIQTCDGPVAPTMYEVAREGYFKYGMKFFFTGIGPCAIMAFPVHIIIILVYE